VDNEVECFRTEDAIEFDVTHEPMPKEHEGTKFRSFIRKNSEAKIATGLETAKEGERSRATVK
jgi:hypothetical protein